MSTRMKWLPWAPRSQARRSAGDVKDVLLLDAPRSRSVSNARRRLHPPDRAHTTIPTEEEPGLLDGRRQPVRRDDPRPRRASVKWRPTTSCSASSISSAFPPAPARRAANRGHVRHRCERHRPGVPQDKGTGKSTRSASRPRVVFPTPRSRRWSRMPKPMRKPDKKPREGVEPRTRPKA